MPKSHRFTAPLLEGHKGDAVEVTVVVEIRPDRRRGSAIR